MLALALLLLPACDGGKLDDTAGGDTGDDVPACEITVEETFPADGATDAYWRAPIEFHLDEGGDPNATITTDIPGELGFNDDFDVVTWVPDAPLTPETSYTATLDWCGGSHTIGFSTSELGLPLEDAAALSGRTYSIDLTQGRFTLPEGLGAVLADRLTQQMILGVAAADAATITTRGAFGLIGVETQDYCATTGEFPEVAFTDAPFFAIGPQDTSLPIAGYAVDVYGLEITGTFAPDGSWFGGATFAGVIDTRPISPIIDPEDEGAICALALNFNDTCEACPNDGQPYCLPLAVDFLVAPQIPDLTLREIAGDGCEGCDTWTQDTVPAPEEQVCPA